MAYASKELGMDDGIRILTKELVISVHQTTAHIRTDAQDGTLFRDKACQVASGRTSPTFQ